MELQGVILDYQTKQPIPFASVTITRPDNSYTGVGTQANVNGQFALSNPIAEYPNFVTISSAGYKTNRAQLYDDFFIDYSNEFYLPRLYKEGEEVIVSAKKNNNSWLLLIGAGLLLLFANKR